MHGGGTAQGHRQVPAPGKAESSRSAESKRTQMICRYAPSPRRSAEAAESRANARRPDRRDVDWHTAQGARFRAAMRDYR